MTPLSAYLRHLRSKLTHRAPLGEETHAHFAGQSPAINEEAHARLARALTAAAAADGAASCWAPVRGPA